LRVLGTPPQVAAEDDEESGSEGGDCAADADEVREEPAVATEFEQPEKPEACPVSTTAGVISGLLSAELSHLGRV
jgi:hypothetical protein